MGLELLDLAREVLSNVDITGTGYGLLFERTEFPGTLFLDMVVGRELRGRAGLSSPDDLGDSIGKPAPWSLYRSPLGLHGREPKRPGFGSGGSRLRDRLR